MVRNTVMSVPTSVGVDAPAPPATSSRSPLFREVIVKSLTVLVAGGAVAWLARLLVARDRTEGSWIVDVILAVAALASIAWSAVQRRRVWTLPVRELARVVPLAQHGEVPIDSLSEIIGPGEGPGPLVPVIQELLRELRRQRGEVATLERETRARVASRTDALERAIGTLKHKASRDPLTGLYNRRMLDEHLPRLIEARRAAGRSQRADEKPERALALDRAGDRSNLCLLMIDVDNFKMLNDTLGHAAGDELLKSIAQLIRSAIRDNDLAFRCGGDEFIVVLDGCEASAGQAMADRLVSLVDALTRTLHVPRPPRLSVGVSRLADVKSPTPQGMLEEADRMLYEVKGSRRRAAGQHAESR